jgi:DNA-binding LytR/AlgR family response regulator
VGVFGRAPRRGEAKGAHAAALEARLRRAEAAGETIVQLKDGSRVHRVAESDILYVRGADDYCEAALTDGRTILVTMTVARLLATLPAAFVRIHKSYAVNRAHVETVAPRPGGGRRLVLTGGASIPVGRSYGGALASLRGGAAN